MVKVKDYLTRRLKCNGISVIKMLWDLKVDDSTHKLEDKIKESYPCLFNGT